MKKININNRILFFGGVYSNLQALEAMKTTAEKLGFAAQEIVCTGDIVGYCAQPSETLDFVQNWGIHAIQGNVEMSLLDEADDCGCNFEDGSRCDLFSRQWFPFAQAKMTDRNLDYIEGLPEFIFFKLGDKNVFVLHGSHSNTSEFIFESTPWEIKANNFTSTKADIIVGGHCGLPFADIHMDKTWLNAGVIGMPANDGQPNTWYMILENNDGNIAWRFHTLAYDHALANQLMLDKPLPKTYAQTLLTGIWDNCEILPQKESDAQGKVIKF